MGDTKVATFAIDSEKAEQAVQRMNNLMQLMGKTAEDARKELSQVFVDVHGQMNAPLDQNKKKVEENTKSLQGFRTEQRLNNFVMREGSQSLMSLVFAYAYLNQQQDKAPGAAQKVANSLITGFMAANALQFAFFGLGQMGEKMGGKVGAALTKISSYGGEIAIVVGTIVAAHQAFEELMKTTDRYSEARQKVFLGNVPAMSDKALLESQSAIQGQIKGLAATNPLRSMAGAGVTGDWGSFTVALQNEKTLYELREKEKAVGGEILERNEKNRSTILAINQLIANAVYERDHEATSIEAMQAANEKVVKLEREKAALLKTNEERRRTEMGVILALREAQAANVANNYDKQRYDAALENDKKLFQIEEDRKKAIREGGNAQLINKTAQQQVDEANLTLGQKILKIHYDEQHSLALLKAENLNEEKDKIEARYKAEEKLIQKNLDLGVYKKEEAEARFFALRRQREEELANLQVKTLGELAQGFQAIEQGLASIGMRADSTLSRMIQMAQVALKIAQLVSAMSAKPQGAETSDYLNIFGNILGFVGLFDTGGWTGPGSRSQVAGLVHRDEIVFEQPITQRYRNELLSLRKGLQRGVPMGAAMPVSDNGNLATAVLVSEIRSLKEAVRSLEIQVPVQIHGTLEGQKFMRKEMPGYEKYQLNKQVDKT